jgi:tetratricopeptide (TPR) repeat protein
MASENSVHSRAMRWLLSGALAVLVMLGNSVASRARESITNPKQEAKAHFRAGESHYNLNEFIEAQVEFKEAYRLYPDPVFLFNLGQCERQLGHLEEAILFYRSYLRKQPKAPNRQDVLRRIDEIEETLKNQPAVPDKSPAPAPLAPPPPIATQPASAQPASAPAALPTNPPAAPASSEDATTQIDLTATPESPAQSEAAPIYKRWWFWTAVAVVAVGASVGVYAATSGGEAAGPVTGLGTKEVF